MRRILGALAMIGIAGVVSLAGASAAHGQTVTSGPAGAVVSASLCRC